MNLVDRSNVGKNQPLAITNQSAQEFRTFLFAFIVCTAHTRYDENHDHLATSTADLFEMKINNISML